MDQVPSDPTALITRVDVLEMALTERYSVLSPDPEKTITTAMEKHKHPLFGRKETKRFLTNLIVQFLANVRAGGTDRMQYPVALAATVPGCGKTRMCLSTLRDIVPKVCAPPKGTHVPYLRLFVTLNADPGTTWNPKEQDRHPEHAIAKRLLGSYFALPDLDTVANISVKAAMDLIRRTEAARRQIDPRQLHIFIAVDEATRLLDAKVNQSYRLSDHRSLPAVRRRRRFWSQALGPLQDICRKPSTPTWMMIAGTKSDQLTSAISTVIAVDSSLPVEHVPIAPLTGSATARLLDHVQSTAQSSEQTTHGDWRFKPEFMRSIQNVAGLPRSILAALKETSDTLKTIEVAYKQFLDIMSVCDGVNPPSCSVDDLQALGVLYKLSPNSPLFLFPRVDLLTLTSTDNLNERCVTAIDRVFLQLQSFMTIGPSFRWHGWEVFCITILNLRVLVAAAWALKEDPDVRFVPINHIFEGTVSGPDTPRLFVDVQLWRTKNFSERPIESSSRPTNRRFTLSPEGTTGIDGWCIVHEETLAGEYVPVTLVVQCKLDQVESTVSHEYQNELILKATEALPEPQQRSAVVALLTSSRMENLDEALLKERSFVLDRAGMDKFTAGFKFIAEIFWNYNPHLSTVGRMASQFHVPRQTSMKRARAMAVMIDRYRDDGTVFKSAADLRKFLMQHANEQVSKTIRTKNGPVTTVYKYPAEAIPSKKVLQWPYALDAKPRKQKNQ
ncbi:hypothetical protein CAOG_008283 [Capsaspora owczarzaki ATCC 30864]|uniref:Uncharacterized protein n=1 Tax=Capsaspora owczarzaki (strain ATCC 30864) TaxID=595528 RepID=A0A0D2WY43_CAPO3|nr:hypothetical protein CAOG_008283 [Capsaspora owczarzaki ATCC 30864]